MKKIKIIKARPLKEEEEVIDQQSQDVVPEQPTITFESNPLEFILQKYPTLTKTLVELLTEDFRDYITGVYIMAPKPTTFKIVLHNNRYFHLMFMGENKYEAKISGKKYWLAKLGELQLATLSIADLLMLGTPPSTEGPTEELPSAEGTEGPEETPAETPEETPAEEEGGVPELKESIKRFKIVESKLLELQKREYDILTPDAKKVAQDLIKKLGITQDQIKPASSTNIVIYDDNRKDLVAKTSKLYGPANDENSGNFKVGKTSINFKPFKKSGEYYELKPQSLGVTLDKYIPIDQLKKELVKGIKNHPVLDDTQKAYVTALVTGKGRLTPEQKQEIKDNTGFTNEVLKNLGEPLGAIMYADEIGATEVFFPKAGNYPLVDYLLKTPKGEVQVSAKTAKGQGNIIKAPDVNNIIKQRKGKIDPSKQEILDILTTSSGKTGSLNLIPKFGDAALKKRLKQFLKDNPDFDKKGSKYNSLERIALEREMIKQINQQYQFDDEFNKYVTVRYVKYNADPNTLKGDIHVVNNFDVEMASKNSKNHDGERIGFSLGKSE
jgi:hypothetical protein